MLVLPGVSYTSLRNDDETHKSWETPWRTLVWMGNSLGLWHKNRRERYLSWIALDKLFGLSISISRCLAFVVFAVVTACIACYSCLFCQFKSAAWNITFCTAIWSVLALPLRKIIDEHGKRSVPLIIDSRRDYSFEQTNGLAFCNCILRAQNIGQGLVVFSEPRGNCSGKINKYYITLIN